MDISIIPSINASLNALATMFLLLGWIAIRRGDRQQHMRMMVSALVVSALFLACYLTYHTLRTRATGVAHTVYEGEGVLRFIYYSILFTHIPLATLVVPACLTAVYRAVKGQFDRHRRIVRWLWPVWMYVSVTGVLIYLMLYVF